ncbi:hypothetical protein PENTCL1PPCAC_986, partial [Pristionchus entomophagus]
TSSSSSSSSTSYSCSSQELIRVSCAKLAINGRQAQTTLLKKLLIIHVLQRARCCIVQESRVNMSGRRTRLLPLEHYVNDGKAVDRDTKPLAVAHEATEESFSSSTNRSAPVDRKRSVPRSTHSTK